MTTSLPPSPAVLHERLLARLRLRHLKLVEALATHSHLRRAAEAVHISQPAATQMLRELESLFGMPLFERHARGMRITEVPSFEFERIHGQSNLNTWRDGFRVLRALLVERFNGKGAAIDRRSPVSIVPAQAMRSAQALANVQSA